jgi:hypothetical protein
MAPKKTSKKLKPTKSKVIELPGIEGEGVAPISIPELDKLCDKYIREKEKRCKMTPREVAAKGDLMDAMHAHADKLHKNEDGEITYRFDDQTFVLRKGKETLQVVKGDSEVNLS